MQSRCTFSIQSTKTAQNSSKCLRKPLLICAPNSRACASSLWFSIIPRAPHPVIESPITAAQTRVGVKVTIKIVSRADGKSVAGADVVASLISPAASARRVRPTTKEKSGCRLVLRTRN